MRVGGVGGEHQSDSGFHDLGDLASRGVPYADGAKSFRDSNHWVHRTSFLEQDAVTARFFEALNLRIRCWKENDKRVTSETLNGESRVVGTRIRVLIEIRHIRSLLFWPPRALCYVTAHLDIKPSSAYSSPAKPVRWR